MTDINYSLTIEVTDDPSFVALYSPDLEGFTGVGNSIEDCLQGAVGDGRARCLAS